MKIISAGGTGQVGNLLARPFYADGHEVVVLSRTPAKRPWRTVAWDANTIGEWTSEIVGADVVINLAGRQVNCRYRPENRRLIMDSRVNSAKVVGEAIERAVDPPELWLQMSTAMIYAHRFDAPNDEITGIIGGTEPDASAEMGIQHQGRASLGKSPDWSSDAPNPSRSNAHGRRDESRPGFAF